MYKFVCSLILLLCVGCGLSERPVLEHVHLGMTVRGMRLMTNRMTLVSKDEESTTYRAWFRETQGHPVLSPSYPVLLTFDNTDRLTAFNRDTAEELRRQIDRQRRHCDSHHMDHMFERQRLAKERRELKDARNAALAQQIEMHRIMQQHAEKCASEHDN